MKSTDQKRSRIVHFRIAFNKRFFDDILKCDLSTIVSKIHCAAHVNMSAHPVSALFVCELVRCTSYNKQPPRYSCLVTPNHNGVPL